MNKNFKENNHKKSGLMAEKLSINIENWHEIMQYRENKRDITMMAKTFRKYEVMAERRRINITNIKSNIYRYILENMNLMDFFVFFLQINLFYLKIR